jgi:RimJ/RimL family protein N-acetyltransferase
MELTLRKITKEDRDFFVKYLNETKDYHNYLGTPYPYTKKDALEWINKKLKYYKQAKPEKYSYIITLDNVFVGSISFNVINYKNNNAELGYWLAKKYYGKGIMQNAIKMICYIAFKQLNLKRVSAEVSPKNKKSSNVLLKNGFKLDGILRKNFKTGNKYEDTLIYSIINSKI